MKLKNGRVFTSFMDIIPQRTCILVVMDEVKKNRIGQRESGRYQRVVRTGMVHPFTSKLHLHFLTALKLYKINSTTN
jgi:hypothetical protein